jgi:hypothetical protein
MSDITNTIEELVTKRQQAEQSARFVATLLTAVLAGAGGPSQTITHKELAALTGMGVSIQPLKSGYKLTLTGSDE